MKLHQISWSQSVRYLEVPLYINKLNSLSQSNASFSSGVDFTYFETSINLQNIPQYFTVYWMVSDRSTVKGSLASSIDTISGSGLDITDPAKTLSIIIIIIMPHLL